ncbi:MAG: hypothetical protein D6722_05605 [Bacteroidetes bacterium]|nr:MAG: hypothetical protein D6722_05605 [Bacteroidota bacterium]
MSIHIRLAQLVPSFLLLGLMLAAANVHAQWFPNPPYGIYHDLHPVGIGTDQPDARLTIQTNGNEDFLHLRDSNFSRVLVDTNGQVGIGIHNNAGEIRPESQLHLRVKGENGLYIQGNNQGNAYLKISNGIFNDTLMHYIYDDVHHGNQLRIQSSSALVFETDGDNERMRIGKAGKVGIGTKSPNYLLDVYGEGSRIRLKETGTDHWIAMRTDGTAVDLGFGNADLYITPENADEKIFLDPFKKSGVTIGTTTLPNGYRLAVDGDVICEGILVELSTSWPDYVFEPAYPLPTLAEVEQHITEKGHLPGMPSAAEMADKGLDLGDMQLKMMEKIEELTLYILQQEKRIQELEAALSDQ